jgi:hypothetical protein
MGSTGDCRSGTDSGLTCDGNGRSGEANARAAGARCALGRRNAGTTKSLSSNCANSGDAFELVSNSAILRIEANTSAKLGSTLLPSLTLIRSLQNHLMILESNASRKTLRDIQMLSRGKVVRS